MSPESVVQRSADIMFAALDDELLAIDAENGHLYSLNETGGLVWQGIAEPVRVRDLCSQLMAAYDVDSATCERDVLAVLNWLRDADLVSVSDE